MNLLKTTFAFISMSLCLQNQPIHADLIFSQTDSNVNLGNDQTFNAGGSSWEAGDDFTLTTRSILTSIQWAGGLADTPSTRLRIYESAVSTPQSIPIFDATAGITNVGALGAGGFLKELVLPNSGVLLEPNVRYWWTVEYNTIDVGVKGYSDGSGGGTNHTLVQSNNDGGTWAVRNYNTYFSLSGTSIPEPATGSVLALVFLGMANVRLRSSD